MVKKIKVVDVVEGEEAKPVEEPIQETIEVTQPISEEIKPVEEDVVEVDKPNDVKPTVLEEEEEAKPTKQSKQLDYITCDTCNKQMLMKTFKYLHKKVCEAKNKPPPPPTPEPKAKPKRVAKPKEVKPQAEVIQQKIPKPHFNGVVSFNEFQPDPFIAMREQRQIVRTQRVKSLISQAI